MNNFLQMAAEDRQCKKTFVTLMCEAIEEAGLTAKSGNTKTILKRMTPAAHMTLACGTTFTDALGKMVEHKRMIALYTMRCSAGTQPENLWPVCNYMASPKLQYRASRSWQRSCALRNFGGIILVTPTCRLSASTLQDVSCCLVNPPACRCETSDSLRRCNRSVDQA